MIGDRTSDVKLGLDGGLTSILVKTGAAGKDNRFDVEPHYRARNLLHAANWILKQKA